MASLWSSLTNLWRFACAIPAMVEVSILTTLSLSFVLMVRARVSRKQRSRIVLMELPEALGMCQKNITSVGARGIVMFCRFLSG